MAQAVRHDEVEIESQAKELPLLLLKGGQNNDQDQNDDEDQSNSAYVPAGELKYDNPHGWKINKNYAVLIGSLKLCASGKYSTQMLGDKNYEVSFELRLKDNCNINEVELTLTLPNGSCQKNTESLDTYPRNIRISLKAGKFFNSFESGNIAFELKGTESHIKKKGLVIYGVLIKADA